MRRSRHGRDLPARSEGTRPELTGGLLVALGFVGMGGAVSTDLYLPSFPDVQADLGVSAASVQLTLTAFLVGSAVGQLLVGTISDTLGRRRTLLVALTLFALAGYAAVFAPTLAWLVALRFVQGLFGSSGAALARAIVADVAHGERAARGISVLIAMMGLGPVVASPLGAALTSWGGWRAALLGLAVVSTAMLVVAALVVPETLPRESRHPARIGALGRNLVRLTRDRAFVAYALAFALTYASFMVYIASSSFVVQDVFGGSPLAYSLTFSASSLAFFAGAVANARAVRRLGVERALIGAHTLSLGAGVALLILVLAGVLTLWLWVPLACLFAAGVAGGMSNGSALSLGRAAFAAGTGSAGLGLVQFTLGAVSSPVGGLGGGDTAVATTVGMTVGVALAFGAGLAGHRLARRER